MNSTAAEGVLDLLQREDKLSLGGGRMVIWAPEFPLFADRPGFWDHACFLEHRVEPLFTVAVLNEAGYEQSVRLDRRRWTPARLQQSYTAGIYLSLVEEKTLTPQDVLTSHLTFHNTADQDQQLRIVVWTCQPVRQGEGADQDVGVTTATFGAEDVRFTRWVRTERIGEAAAIGVALRADRPPQARLGRFSQATVNYPDWRLTPFDEMAIQGELPDVPQLPDPGAAASPPALFYLALVYPLTVPAGGTASLMVGCALAPDEAEAASNARQVLAANPIRLSHRQWHDFFASAPRFTCSDPYLERYYWYRWFSLRLNAVDTGGRYNLPHPCVFEGINAGWFRHHISYSAQVHAYELRWLRDPSLAQGSVLNFVANQREDGSLPGGIRTDPDRAHHGFYHANWGRSVRQIYRVHPDLAFLQQVYPALTRYAAYFQRERDREGLHLYDVVDQWETGQEYMSRYLFVDPHADEGKPLHPRLKGVDATIYVYELYQNLAWMARELAHPEEAARWQAEAEATRQAILTLMWDETLGMFTDVHPETLARSPVKAVVGFYPFMTDLAGPEHVRALREHLLNPAEFWTDYPLPATSLDDPTFSALGEWKGVRHVCPWNGRAWLMTNSHACEALAEASLHLDPTLRPQAVELIRRTIHMLFVNGDLRYPTSYEYYNPFNGRPPFFRGTDDYMHSWIVDLIIRYVAGLQPGDGGQIVVEPLPFGLEHFRLEDAYVKGHQIAVDWQRRTGLRVYVDGGLVAERPDLGRLEVLVSEL